MYVILLSRAVAGSGRSAVSGKGLPLAEIVGLEYVRAVLLAYFASESTDPGNTQRNLCVRSHRPLLESNGS